MDLEASYFDIPTMKSSSHFMSRSGWFDWKTRDARRDQGTELHPDKTGFIEWRVDEGEWHNSLTMGGWTALIVM
jgi:hypothetical protein